MRGLAWFGLVICTISSMFASANDASDLKPGRIEISYVPPKNAAHEPIYVRVKERQVLERFQDYLSPLRLPATLWLKINGCEGESNAWYEASERSVTVCYEYLDEILRNAPRETTAAGVAPQDAIVGPAVEVFAHEIAHALFDLLRIPILGREEDAADQLAAYMLLQLGKEEARSTVAGVAYMYGNEARLETNVELKRFANVHGLSAQRFYNLLCMAYGADPQLFGDVVQRGYLPESRAEDCADEYRQVDYAVKQLIAPHVDEGLMKSRKKLLRPADG